MHAGLGVTGTGTVLTAIAVGAFNPGHVASMVIGIGMVARLPMVAGWDGLLPVWWSELHPKWQPGGGPGDDSPWRPGAAIRLAALAAFSVALISLIFEILPVGEVANPALFAIKVGGTICAANGLGAVLYRRGARRPGSSAAGGL